MFIDTRRIDSSEPLEFDLCIIGAGAAGITIALETAPSGARIAVLEAGGFRYGRRTQALLDGDVIGQAYPPLTATRLAAFGGSTRLWAGWCRPLDEIDFETREWVPESGWPFGRETLVPFYRRAHELCGLADFEYDPAVWESRGKGERLRFHAPDVTTSMFHVNPVNFGKFHGDDLRKATNVRVFLHAIVDRLRLDDTAGSIDKVAVRTLTGRRLTVRARTFVLAAAGIENARILMLSGDCPERAIGNRHGLVGRFFSDHAFVQPGEYIAARPWPSLQFYFPTSARKLMPSGRRGVARGASVRAAFSLSRTTLEREQLLNSAFHFRPAYEAHAVYSTPEVRAFLEFWDPLRGRGNPAHALAELRRASRAPHRVAHAVWRRLVVSDRGSGRWPMRGFFECQSLESNRVRLTDRRDQLDRPLPIVEWRLSELDIRSVRRAWGALDGALRSAGLGRLELAFRDEADSWRAASVGGRHHMGTTRMHQDPSRGVVDANSRVHGISNLYVAGSSTFPTAGFANPTLTIVALAVRLAQHLALRL